MTECPTCGQDDFATKRGMKAHHSQVHGESIAGIEVQCIECDSTTRVFPSRAEEHDHHYCSIECQKRHKSEKITRECANCGIEMTKKPSRFDDRENHFCSYSCQGQFTKNERREEYDCDWCGTTITVQKSRLERRKRHYCGRGCYRKWLSHNRTGDDHPQYNGHEDYYGENWHRQRRKALERDNHECQNCGMSNTESKKKFGKALNVHHKTPRREYDDLQMANRLSNLITYCPPCHFEVEEKKRLANLQ